MNTPRCSLCGIELRNWEGNVMVDLDRFINGYKIDYLRVVCKECQTETRGHLHCLWELRWFKSNFLFLLTLVLRDLTGDGPWKWSRNAVDDFWNLAEKAFPGQAEDPILSVFDHVNE